jgi:pimeloyl-ACP methyl ester carboxylesterase
MNFRTILRVAVLAAVPLTVGCAQFPVSEETGPIPRLVDAGKADVGKMDAGKAAPPLRLAVTDTGQGKPLLLLHGLGASSYTWKRIIPALARHNRVIAIDLKGFGASDKPQDGKYSIFDQAELIKTFIQKENLTNLTVIGHSYGGGVALALALKMAEDKDTRLQRLVLVDSLAYRQPIPFFFTFIQIPVVGDVGFGLTPPEVQTASALAIAYHDKGKLSAESVWAYAKPLYSEGGRYALVRTVEQLVPEDIDQFSDRYRTLKIPALLVWCRQDKIVPLSYGARLNADLQNSNIEVIDQCGHIPQEEQPEATAQIIGNFLAK